MPQDLTRRSFVAGTGSCLAYMSASFAFATPTMLRRWATPRERVVAQEPWGRIEEVGPGLWALISTPQTGDFTTISNGGIIAGRDGVVVFESTGSDAGAQWMTEQARALAGQAPSHLVISHHHGDHTAGAAAFTADGNAPVLHVTAPTRDRVASGFDGSTDAAQTDRWSDVDILDPSEATEIDLGDRVVLVRPYVGHTESDVTIDLPEDGIVWGGDLIWNGWFPNYTDATPTRLGDAVRAIQADGRTTCVPGHGPLAGAAEVSTYLSVLDHVEEAGRAAAAAGMSAADAAAAYALPEAVSDWVIFNPQFFERAMAAWIRQLGGGA